MKLGAEDIELIKTMDWVRYNKLDKIIWHTANERSVSPQSGSILKRKGVKAGVADLTVARQSNGYPGMYLELKVKGGKLSEHQRIFLHDMEEEGYKTAIAWSSDEAIQCIAEYLNLDKAHHNKADHE